MSDADTHYLVVFQDPERDETVRLRCRVVEDSSLGLSFVALRDFVFARGGAVVNPTDEALAERFRDVKTLHLSIYRVLSVTEVGVGHGGLSFDHDRSNLVVFPTKG